MIQTENYEKIPVGCCVIDTYVHGGTHTLDRDKDKAFCMLSKSSPVQSVREINFKVLVT
jgi:hypothetical protein